MRHCNINNMNKSEKYKLESNIAPYVLKIFGQKDQARVRASAKTHTDYLNRNSETNGNEFCFDTFDKTDHFVSLVKKN